MSRRVNLDEPRNSQNDYGRRGNHSFSHNRNLVNEEEANDNPEVNTENKENAENNNEDNSLKKNAVKKGLLTGGGLKFLTGQVSGDVEADGFEGFLSFFKKLKMAAAAIIIALFVFAIGALTIFLGGDDGVVPGSEGSGAYVSAAESCSSVMISEPAEYAGQVELEDYVAGVVAGMADGYGDLNFYRDIAILVRTEYLANYNGACKIHRDGEIVKYIDVNEAKDKDLIKRAVSDTKGVVLTTSDDKIVDVSFSLACVVNKDDNYYYVRYNNDKYQKIPIEFDQNNQLYKGKLSALYATVDTSVEDYKKRSCPSGNDSKGLSLIGTLYLTTIENYNYKSVLNYYYGEVNEAKAQRAFDGKRVNGFVNPVSTFPRCTSSFGCRLHPTQNKYKWHAGIDIPVIEGTAVYATKSGKVTAVRDNVTGPMPGSGSYGNYIDIDHGDGTLTRYAHLKYGGINVRVGTVVAQGQTIALSGNTGDSTGPHLHYEVHLNGQLADPYNYLDTSVISQPDSCNYGKSVDKSYCGR